MKQFIFVLHLPQSSVGVSVLSDGQTIDWSEFESTVQTIGLPDKQSNKLTGKPQRIARNLWLIPSEESARFLIGIERLSKKFQVDFSAFITSGEIESMTK